MSITTSKEINELEGLTEPQKRQACELLWMKGAKAAVNFIEISHPDIVASEERARETLRVLFPDKAEHYDEYVRRMREMGLVESVESIRK